MFSKLSSTCYLLLEVRLKPHESQHDSRISYPKASLVADMLRSHPYREELEVIGLTTHYFPTYMCRYY